MATARIERNIDRNILTIADAIDVRETPRGARGFHRFLTSSTLGAMTIQPVHPHGYWSMHGSGYCPPSKPMPTGNLLPGLGARARAERRAIRQRYQVV